MKHAFVVGSLGSGKKGPVVLVLKDVTKGVKR